MNQRSAKILYAALMLFCGFSGIARADDAPSAPQATAQQVCDQFEPQAARYLDAGSPIDAVKALADYEQALLALYPPTTFEDGDLRSPLYHLSAHLALDGWTRLSLQDAHVDDVGQLISGFDAVAVFQGRSEFQRLLILNCELGRLRQRLGVGGSQNVNLIPISLLRTLGSTVGKQTSLNYAHVGNFPVAVMNVTNPFGNPALLVALGDTDRMYIFALVSLAQNFDEDRRNLLDTIRTVDIHYQPANASAIAQIRASAHDPGNITQALATVRALAGIGEYGAAADELALIRTLLAEKMPQPAIANEVGTYPAYGLTLRNPDPLRWKLSIQKHGALSTIALEDTYSATRSGLYVTAFNTILTNGPKFYEKMADPQDDKFRRSTLLCGARGDLLNVGGRMDAEKYTTFKGFTAYEVSGRVSAPNTRVKVIYATADADQYAITEVINTQQSRSNARDLDEILDQALQITGH